VAVNQRAPPDTPTGKACNCTHKIQIIYKSKRMLCLQIASILSSCAMHEFDEQSQATPHFLTTHPSRLQLRGPARPLDATTWKADGRAALTVAGEGLQAQQCPAASISRLLAARQHECALRRSRAGHHGAQQTLCAGSVNCSSAGNNSSPGAGALSGAPRSHWQDLTQLTARPQTAPGCAPSGCGAPRGSGSGRPRAPARASRRRPPARCSPWAAR